MRREDQILVEILADFVNGRSVRCLPDVSLEALYETAQKHNVAGIAAAMLLPVLKEQKKEDAYRTFQEVYMATVYRSVLLEEEVKAFAARMEETQVPYAFFKGCELRDLYPTPELRTMGDVDVLVRDEDMARTAAVLRAPSPGWSRGRGADASFRRRIILSSCAFTWPSI